MEGRFRQREQTDRGKAKAKGGSGKGSRLTEGRTVRGRRMREGSGKGS